MELLAPAGTIEVFETAVESGADAVYIGAPFFNARELARHFRMEEIAAMIDFAKSRKVKLYLAMNSLVKESEIGQAVIDAGADVVFGHGPHKYQKIEVYKGKPILHSLAQFAFDDTTDNYRASRMPEGLLLRLDIENKTVKSVSMVPSWREADNQVRLYDPGKGRELYGYLKSVNEEGALLSIKGKEIVVEGLEF